MVFFGVDFDGFCWVWLGSPLVVDGFFEWFSLGLCVASVLFRGFFGWALICFCAMLICWFWLGWALI